MCIVGRCDSYHAYFSRIYPRGLTIFPRPFFLNHFSYYPLEQILGKTPIPDKLQEEEEEEEEEEEDDDDVCLPFLPKPMSQH